MAHYSVQLEQLIWWNGPSQLPFILSKAEQEYTRNKSVVVGNLLWENYYPLTEDFVLFLEEIKRKKIPIVMIVNFMNKNSEIVKKITEMGVSTIYVDFFLWRVYQEIIIKQQNKTNLTWNCNADKFLFLTGKPDKTNRVGLLWELYKKGLLSQAIWSLYMNEQDREPVLEVLTNQGVNRQLAEQFVEKHQCIPDDADVIFWSNGGSHYGGIPYSESLYADVKFRIVSETRFAPGFKLPWITEKTWLTIVNRCPFIMAGDQGSVAYLESLGFRPFKEYLAIPDYDNIRDTQDRLNAIVTNTESWLNNNDSLKEIQQDVEHNYNLFVQLGKEMEASLLEQIQNNGLQLQASELIPTDDAIAKLAK